MATQVELLYGPLIIGVFLNMILYGVLLVQMYTYYRTCKTDALWIRYLVLYLLLVETANSVCEMYTIYEPLVIQSGLPEATKFYPTVLFTGPILVVAVSTPIQLFFAWKIWLLTKSAWLAILISLFSFTSLAGGIWTGYETVILKLFINNSLIDIPAMVWLLSACVADVLITGTLVIILSKRRTGFLYTDDAISKIVRLTLQTGLIISICAIGDVILFMVFKRIALNFIWDFALVKLYANCLLSTLNSRLVLKDVVSPGRWLSTRRQMYTFESSVNYIFELDAQKTFESTRAYSSRDAESGVTVTKVVHRMEDPAPDEAEET